MRSQSANAEAGVKAFSVECTEEIFKKLDMEGDGHLSRHVLLSHIRPSVRHEFIQFVREGLGLSMWDVPESELLQLLEISLRL